MTEYGGAKFPSGAVQKKFEAFMKSGGFPDVSDETNLDNNLGSVKEEDEEDLDDESEIGDGSEAKTNIET
jgi:hypothetical protein